MKPFNPESFLMNATTFRAVSRMKPDDCKTWMREVSKNFENFVKDQQYEPTFSDDILGDLIMQAWNTQYAGLSKVLKQREANPSGLPKNPEPG